MGGGGTETSTQSSGPTNPMVNETLTSLLGGLQSRYNASENAAAPSAINTGLAMQYSGAMNPDYARGVGGATANFADAASGGQNSANDPYYRQLGDDTLRDVNAMFANSGRFGSGSHVETAVKALGDVNNANIAADRNWQTTSAGMLPQMFAAGQAPGAAVMGVGQTQQQMPWWNLQNASSILAGAAGAGGQTTTQTTPTAPWWQSAISLGGQFL